MAEKKARNSDSDKFFVSVMPEGDLNLLIPDSNYAFSLPETKKATRVLENTEPKSSQDRRKSTGNLDIPYTKVKILSRYLESSSSSSCHDYCKFGAHHAAESKPRRPSFGRIPEAGQQNARRVTFSAAESQSPRQASLLTGGKNVTSSWLSSSPRRATNPVDQGDIRKPEAKSRFGTGKMASPPEKKAVSAALRKNTRQPNTSSLSAKQFRNGSPTRTKKQGEVSTGSVSSFGGRNNVSSRKGEASGAQFSAPSTAVLMRARKEGPAPRSTSAPSRRPLRHAEGEPAASRRSSRPCTPLSASPRLAAGPRDVARSRAGNGGGTSTLDKASPARKPTFRGGKGVELEPKNPSSRRIAARQKSPGRSQDGKPESQLGSLKPTETRESEDDRAQNEHEKVALRHSDAKEKSPVNSLNNVIEATASKLAGEKHGKVRALVGAFETVISLQDRNQAPS